MKQSATAPRARTSDSALVVLRDVTHEPRHAESIAHSHERCSVFGIEPARTPDLSPMVPQRLAEIRDKHRRLCEQAGPVMALLHEQIVSTHSMVLLTDAHGTILQAVGNDSFMQRAQQVALAPGVNWAEQSKGTNAIGTALYNESATLVHGSEHFVRANRFLTCSAAPIFDHYGEILGVLDVTGDQRSYHPHTLGLVSLSARMIEHQWINDKFRHGLRLCFHRRPEMLGTIQEAMLALSPDGAIVGANRSAIELLGLNVAALRMLGLEAIFGITVASVADYFQRNDDVPMELRSLYGDARDNPVYARAQFNWPPRWRTASAAAPAAENALHDAAPATLEVQEIAAIRRAVEASGGNISRAARQLGVGRSTIYRKLRPRAEPKD